MRIVLTVFFLWVAQAVWAQTTDSLVQQIATDTVSVMQETSDYPNPKKAAYLSLAIPGAGHVYNKKYWKLPVVYGAMGGAVAGIIYNSNRYNLLKDAHCQRLLNESVRQVDCPSLSKYTQGEEEAFNFLVSERTSSNLQSLRNSFDKNRQLSWIGLVAAHVVVNAAWAFVDSHLLDFDISDDLSLQLQPSIQSMAYSSQTAAGIGLQFQIK